MKTCFSKLNLFKKKKSSSHAFQIGKLPILPMIIVIRMMRLDEQIQLAMTSRKMESNVATCKLRTTNCSFFFESNAVVRFINESVLLYFSFEGIQQIGNFTGIGLQKWMKQSHTKSSELKNVAIVFRRVHALFCSRSVDFAFDFRCGKNSIRDVLMVPVLKNWRYINFRKGEIDAEELNFLFNMADHNKTLKIGDVNVPSDYNHEKAFEFLQIDYSDAKWVKIENLFSLKNSSSVILRSTSFNSKDINIFLKYWVNAEFDMFEHLHINISPNVDLKRIDVFDGILALYHFTHWRYCIFLAAKPTENRKRVVARISYERNIFKMITFDLGRPGSTKNRYPPFTHSREYKILEDLKKIAELEQELKIFETSSTKDKIIEQINRLKSSLTNRNVFFLNGKACTSSLI